MNDIALIRYLTEKPHHIRNIFTIAHVDHGKSTLIDLLYSTNACVASPSNPDLNQNDNNHLQGIVTRGLIHPLFFKLPADCSFPQQADGPDFLINLLSPPRNVDFSAESTANFHACDGIYVHCFDLVSSGSLLIVDAVEGVCVQTETYLRKSLMDRVIPILAINKMDRVFFELQLGASEEFYQLLYRLIESVNDIIGAYHDNSVGDITVQPHKGNVVFMSAIGGWGFTLKQFALMYADKFGVDEEKMMNKLWGDHYYDRETKKWQTTPLSTSGKTLSRAFCKFVLDPLAQLIMQ